VRQPRLRRRKIIQAAGAILGGVVGGRLGCLAAWPSGAAAAGSPSKRVVLVYGVPTLDVTTAFFGAIPQTLGYYREEGIEVDVQTVNGASAAVNLLTSGQAHFSSHGTAGLFEAVDKGAPVKGFICQIPDYFVSIAVLKDSPITSVEQLRGKTIGVNAVGGAPDLVMHAVAQRQGWTPGKDVELLAVGTGVPALDALRRGRVQALALWDSIYASFEFLGAQFRFLRPPPLPSIGFTHTSNVLTRTIQDTPELVTAMARAQAKSLVFMAGADPAELTKLHYKVYPATRPTGMSDADAVRLGVALLRARVPFMRFRQRVMQRIEPLGDATDAMIASMRDLLYSGKQLKQALPADAYFTRQFVAAMNDFNFKAILGEARKFKA
jgi:NitT/TauT family transport system substrate-binding protein